MVGESTGIVSTSYVTGQVRGNDSVGSLVGYSLNGTIANSYWDTQTSGIADDSNTNSPEGKTTAALQVPTGYIGIYANWNVNVDSNDNPWAFGADYQYPVLGFGRTQAQVDAQYISANSSGRLKKAGRCQPRPAHR